MENRYQRAVCVGLVLAASIASMAHAQVSQRDKELEAEFLRAMDDCAKRSVALLDDGISSAAIVSEALGNFCLREGHYKKLDEKMTADKLSDAQATRITQLRTER